VLIHSYDSNPLYALIQCVGENKRLLYLLLLLILKPASGQKAGKKEVNKVTDKGNKGGQKRRT
jgi:hypothetical protein